MGITGALGDIRGAPSCSKQTLLDISRHNITPIADIED